MRETLTTGARTRDRDSGGNYGKGAGRIMAKVWYGERDRQWMDGESERRVSRD